ncbi:hypothetical protein D9615_005980 [Tricholomella constricta]|uniref:PH domain-containing protein n=1 Tax=Tricholomella constricta TaxID=117010 RepID=A0A8H5M3E4_9AGAR|nr:hypothetical protein D9615_005980 [Tricholomella constricta]
MASSSDGIPVLPPMPDFSAHSTPFSSAGDMKFHLQNLLDNKEKQLQQAATLGQRVLAQRVELEERIKQLQELEADKSEDDDIDDQARERYAELADTLVSWDNENVQLSSAVGSSKLFPNGKTPSPSVAFAELPREERERSKPSAGTSAAQSRRAKNAAHRADDVEFAFEIGSGLLTEVRRLQSLLGERDKAIQDMKEEKDDLEKSVEALRTALRQQEQSSDKYKEENWNLEVTLQELRTQLGDSQASTQRLEGEHKRLTKLLATSRDAGDQHKNEADRLVNLVEEMKAKHETDIAQARKHAAGLARDKSDLQQTVDSLKNEAAKAGRRFPRFGSPLTPNGAAGSDFLLTPAGDDADTDIFTGGASTNRRRLDSSAIFGADGDFADFADSPEVSPVRPPFLAANHPSNEIEALQQRLAHAQRQINTLKGTLQREKQLRMEYRSKLEATSEGFAAAAEIDDEVGNEDLYEDDDTTLEGKKKNKPRTITPFKVGGRGRGRGRGRGGITLIQRLGMAASSPSSEYNDDDGPHHLDDSPPPVPPIPIRFSQPEEDEHSLFSTRDLERDQILPNEDDEAREYEREREQSPPRSPSPMEPNSNRASITSVDGMDPVFANVLRRVPSNGSSYAGSPLRQAVLGGSARGRTVGRRSRGGVPYKEARPPSLIDAPDVLSAELLGMAGSSPMKSREILEEIEETYRAREAEMVEIGCQTEPEKQPETEVVVVPETAEIAVQVETEPEPAPAVVELPPAPVPVETVDQAMQTDEEPTVVIQTAEIGTQHAYEEPVPQPAPVPVLVEMSIGTDPEPQSAPVPVPVLVQAETQTPQPQMADVDTQTTATFVRPEMSDLGIGRAVGDMGARRTTITQYDRSLGSLSGDSTITRPFLAEHEGSDDENDGDETETGADTEAETDLDDYHDARQSIMMSTPSGTESRDEFHSVMTMSDNEFSESDDDGESIKASRMTSSQNGHASIASSAVGGGRRPSSYYAAVTSPPPEYEDVGVSADFKPEPERIIVEVQVPAPLPPKPEVKEISIQTDDWKPPAPPPAPVVVPVLTQPPTSVPTPGLYRVGSSSNQQFQFISPPTPLTTSSAPPRPASAASAISPVGLTPAAIPIPVAAPGPLSSILRESSGTFGRSRTTVADRRQSLESVISSIADELPDRSRVPSAATMLTTVDRSKPPMMVLPPPPKAPPPPTSMPPPSFIPERRIPTSSTGSYDMPPPRPSSPPPPELIQRATTPTFGAVLSVPGKGMYNFRQAGSSMPPSQAGLRQPPSTSSFRSAANAATYAHHSTPPPGTLSSLSVRERERRQFSQTSLISERSVASPRSSMSSDHFHAQALPDPVTPNKTADTTPRAGGTTTDPAIIHAITQTMIGEFLYKYTRRTIGKGHGQGRHKRFFWVHPYTKTLYWSSADPGSSNVSESSAKSAYIDGVRSVLDPNPMPPGLHQYSVIVSTPQREMKFTAPTKERHDIWLNALQYLLSRPAGMSITSPGNATVVPRSPISQEFTDDERRPRQASSPQSQRSARSVQAADTWNTTPRGQRSRSQLSTRGSIGKRSGTPAAEYLRWNGPESPYSPTRSFVDVAHHDEEDLDFELHGDTMSDDGYEGLENVRACCDGRHTVGHSGKHHHHHHNGDHLEPGNRDPGPARPVSPSAWSFRSRTGSAHSTDGGGIFSWGRGDDGKLRFGSKRSHKTVPINDG